MIDRTDAAAALADIAQSRRRSIELSGYAHAGDIVLAWGLVWLVCNLAVQFVPQGGANSWPIGIVLASGFSFWRGARWPPFGRAGPDWRIAATAGIALGFLVLVMVIARFADPRQANAVISLAVAAGYGAAGIWAGRRFALAGGFIALLVLVAWFFDRSHFHLWMGLGGGGTLVATGLWLRRA